MLIAMINTGISWLYAVSGGTSIFFKAVITTAIYEKSAQLGVGVGQDFLWKSSE
jgi:hypothetical protein